MTAVIEKYKKKHISLDSALKLISCTNMMIINYCSFYDQNLGFSYLLSKMHPHFPQSEQDQSGSNCNDDTYRKDK